jgi:hypothetical protein
MQCESGLRKFHVELFHVKKKGKICGISNDRVIPVEALTPTKFLRVNSKLPLSSFSGSNDLPPS